MPYLVCENCDGYYELKEGESGDDFKACECGGNLIYQQDLDKKVDKRDETQEKIIICPKCGSEVSEYSILCRRCGVKLSANSKVKKNKEPTIICAACREENYFFAYKCRYCGRRLKKEEKINPILDLWNDMGIMAKIIFLALLFFIFFTGFLYILK